jgi:hypothetical protein
MIIILPSSATDEPETIPHVKIVSPLHNTTVSPVNLTVVGVSSDERLGNCKVYLQINGGVPQLVTSGGPNNTIGDLPVWYFSSSLDIHPLKIGKNNLTASYFCDDDPSPTVHDSIEITVDPKMPPNRLVPAPLLLSKHIDGGLPSTGGGRLESTN